MLSVAYAVNGKSFQTLKLSRRNPRNYPNYDKTRLRISRIHYHETQASVISKFSNILITKSCALGISINFPCYHLNQVNVMTSRLPVNCRNLNVYQTSLNFASQTRSTWITFAFTEWSSHDAASQSFTAEDEVEIHNLIPLNTAYDALENDRFTFH